MALKNISDQLYAYTQENMEVARKIMKENNVSIDIALKATEVAAKEMIADCLFHMNTAIDDLGSEFNEVATAIYSINEEENEATVTEEELEKIRERMKGNWDLNDIKQEKEN